MSLEPDRIGMRRDEGGDFDHPGVPLAQARLRRHVLYRIERNDRG